MTGSRTAPRAALDGATAAVSGAGAAARVLREHLGALGVAVAAGGASEHAAEAVLTTATGRHTAVVEWAGPLTGLGIVDETTAQAACGIMHVHGRRTGSPRGLAVDYCSTAAGSLAVSGLLACALRGEREVRTSVAEAALLTVSQYLAAAGADEPEAVDTRAGGPPFTSADGVRFEVEALVPEVWAGFWAALGAPAADVAAGWRPFQFRYATAAAPLPDALHTAALAVPYTAVVAAGAAAGASVTAVRGPDALPDGGVPWRISLTGSAPSTSDEVTVWEAGRRIQAPLAAHLLRLLGARVVRVEPPGGDPLRGMPPACGGISARWLALNRGKAAVELDLKDPADRQRLRESVAPADVFLHNWAPGTARRWDLTAEDFADGVVYARTSGWADADADDLPIGTDFMVQARTGLGALARAADEPPAPSLMTLVDVLGGLIGAEAVLAGLLTRRATGRGARVESSLLGAATALCRTRADRAPAGFRVPADGDAVTTDLAALPGDPRFAAVLGRDERGCPELAAPWRFR